MNISKLTSYIPGLSLTALVAGASLIAACGPKKQESTDAGAARPSSQTGKTGSSPNDSASMPGAGEQKKPLSEADKAWEEVLRAMRPPPYPEKWQTNQPSKDEMKQFEFKNGFLATAAATKAKDFYTRFPEHKQAAEARLQEYGLLNAAVQLGYTNSLPQLLALEQERLQDPKLIEDERLQIRMGQMQRSAVGRREESRAAVLAGMEKDARALLKEFPKRSEISAVLLSIAHGWLDANQTEKSRTLAKEVVNANLEPGQKEDAERLLKKLDRLGQPLDLKFKAVDGRAVDLQQMTNKVVLVDFWATWCRPCMADLPKVKAAYEKLHPQGFEIIGISFDQEKATLQKVLTQEKMAWPQYFETSGEENQFGKQFEIAGIPALWLVDKKGVLRDLNARENLVEKVEKLLAEK